LSLLGAERLFHLTLQYLLYYLLDQPTQKLLLLGKHLF